MRWRTGLSLALLVAISAGCRTYSRRPLALDDYAKAWTERSLEIEPVFAYAASLSQIPGPTAPFDSADGLSLAEAVAVALHFNPRLRSARAAAEVPLAGAKEAGWWPDPQLEAEVLRFLNRGSKTRFKPQAPSIDGISAGGLETTPAGFRRVEGDYIDDPWIVGGSLSITIPISGRLAVEKDLAWSQYSAAWRRILVKEWELLTRLRLAWLDWSTSQERLRITQDYVVKLEAIANIAQQLMSAGEMKPTESRLLRIELAKRQANIILFERDVEEKRLTLLALMGLAPHAPVALHAEVIVPTIEVPPDERRSVLMHNHPRIRAVEADYETAEQQLRLEIRRQYPDLDVGPSYSFDEGFSRFGLGFGFPLPLWNHNRQAVAQAIADRDATKIEAEVAVEEVLSELAQQESRLDFAHRQRQVLLDDVAPLTDKQVQDSRTLLGLGEVDVLLLRDAVTSSLETKLDLLDATLAEAKAAHELQQMLRPRWFTPPDAELQERD